MSNTFNSELFPRILAGALDVLNEEMALVGSMPKDFSNAAGQLGQQISVMVPYDQSVGSVTPAAVPPALTDNIYDAKLVTIDQWKNTRFSLTTKEATEIQAGVVVPKQIEQAARALGRSVNQKLHSLYTKVYGYAGTAGTNPFASNVNPVAELKEVLDNQLCPDDERRLIIGLTAQTKALQLDDFKKMLNAGDAEAFRRGRLGSLYGMDIFRDRDVPTHTAGTASADTAVKTNTALGAVSVPCDTGTGTLVVGDVISFANHSGTYVVTAAVADVSDGTIAIDPPLRAAVVDGEVITKRATHVVNLAYEPGAYALVMRTPGASIEGAPTYGQHMVMTHPKSGIPLKLSYLPGYHAAQWELSILYGCQLIDPRRAARLAG